MEVSLNALLEAGTAVISDVFDTMDLLPPILDNALFPIPGPGVRFIGPAYTITGESHRWSGGGDQAKLAAIDAMVPGVVPVWAGNDIQGVCCFGDLLSEAMKARGCAGVVVDGGGERCGLPEDPEFGHDGTLPHTGTGYRALARIRSSGPHPGPWSSGRLGDGDAW